MLDAALGSRKGARGASVVEQAVALEAAQRRLDGIGVAAPTGQPIP
jgi:hypothetical protein